MKNIIETKESEEKKILQEGEPAEEGGDENPAEEGGDENPAEEGGDEEKDA